jgi:hypothetical protein
MTESFRTAFLRLAIPLLVFPCTGLRAATAEEPADVRAIAHVLDDFHHAAAVGEEERYFGHFAPEGVFLGTDPTERWTVDAFRTFAHPYFARGKAWVYEPIDRHVTVTGDLAVFDEALRNEKYGICRGTGALRRIGGAWKIVQYSLSFPIPNAEAMKVLEMIAAGRASTPHVSGDHH